MTAAEDESDIVGDFRGYIPDPEPALITAIRACDLARVQSLLKENPSTIEERDIYGDTPLFWATVQKRKDILKAVIDAGAKLDEKDMSNTSGRTALMEAVLLGWPNGAEILINAGANPDIQDVNGRTALMLAVINGRADIIKALIDAGAELDKKDVQERTALDFMSKERNGGISEILETAFKVSEEKQKIKREQAAAVELASRHQEILKQKKPANPLKRKPL